MHTIKDMTETIRIPNIEKYTQEIVNGELVLTPKKFKKFSDDEFINEQVARQMVLEYSFHGCRSEKYESKISELDENDEYRELLKRQVGMIHQIKLIIVKRFVKRFGKKLWDDLMCEYSCAGY